MNVLTALAMVFFFTSNGFAESPYPYSQPMPTPSSPYPTFSPAPYPSTSPAPTPTSAPAPNPSHSPVPMPTPYSAPMPAASAIPCKYRPDDRIVYQDEEGVQHTLTAGRGNDGGDITIKRKVWELTFEGNSARLDFRTVSKRHNLIPEALACNAFLNKREIMARFEWTERPNATCYWKKLDRDSITTRRYVAVRRLDRRFVPNVTAQAEWMHEGPGEEENGARQWHRKTYDYQGFGTEPENLGGLPMFTFTHEPNEGTGTVIEQSNFISRRNRTETATIDRTSGECEVSVIIDGRPGEWGLGRCHQVRGLNERAVGILNSALYGADAIGLEQGGCSDDWLINLVAPVGGLPFPLQPPPPEPVPVPL